MAKETENKSAEEVLWKHFGIDAIFNSPAKEKIKEAMHEYAQQAVRLFKETLDLKLYDEMLSQSIDTASLESEILKQLK